jgi:hypothetical protein
MESGESVRAEDLPAGDGPTVDLETPGELTNPARCWPCRMALMMIMMAAR